MSLQCRVLVTLYSEEFTFEMVKCSLPLSTLTQDGLELDGNAQTRVL